MFNYYFVAIPFLMLVALFAGYKYVRKQKAGSKVVIRYATESLERITALCLSFIATVMVATESGRGILQAIDNTIATDDPTGVWALVFWAGTIAVVFGMLALLFWFVLRFAEYKKVERFKLSAKKNGYGYKVVH